MIVATRRRTSSSRTRGWTKNRRRRAEGVQGRHDRPQFRPDAGRQMHVMLVSDYWLGADAKWVQGEGGGARRSSSRREPPRRPEERQAREEETTTPGRTGPALEGESGSSATTATRPRVGTIPITPRRRRARRNPPTRRRRRTAARARQRRRRRARARRETRRGAETGAGDPGAAAAARSRRSPPRQARRRTTRVTGRLRRKKPRGRFVAERGERRRRGCGKECGGGARSRPGGARGVIEISKLAVPFQTTPRPTTASAAPTLSLPHLSGTVMVPSSICS